MATDKSLNIRQVKATEDIAGALGELKAELATVKAEIAEVKKIVAEFSVHLKPGKLAETSRTVAAKK